MDRSIVIFLVLFGALLHLRQGISPRAVYLQPFLIFITIEKKAKNPGLPDVLKSFWRE